MELYEMMANDLSEVIDDIDSQFLSDSNRPSFVALVGYADRNNHDELLSGWLECFEKKKDLLSDQKENFVHMRDDFDKYCRENQKSA